MPSHVRIIDMTFPDVAVLRDDTTDALPLAFAMQQAVDNACGQLSVYKSALRKSLIFVSAEIDI